MATVVGGTDIATTLSSLNLTGLQGTGLRLIHRWSVVTRSTTIFEGTYHCLFETAILSTTEDGIAILERYSTWDEAMAGHARYVAELERSAANDTPKN